MNESVVKLQKRIAKNELEDEVDLQNYIQLASRMKALGDSTAFDTLPIVFKKSWYRKTGDLLLRECCLKLMYYLDEPILSEEMAGILIQIQDMKLFYEYSKDKNWYPKGNCEDLKALMRAASEVHPDKEVCEILKLWLNTYPIPEEYRLFDVSE